MTVNEDDVLERFGFPARPEDLPSIRSALKSAIGRESAEQGGGDTLGMRALCALLFVAGAQDDCLLVWTAKQASMDAGASIEVHLMCPSGPEKTADHLARSDLQPAGAALDYLLRSINSGDFQGFDPDEYKSELVDYYRL